MAPGTVFSTYDLIDGWQRLFALPSALFAAGSRALDDRWLTPPPLAALRELGLADELLKLRRSQSAGLKLFARLTEQHLKPAFGIDHVEVDGEQRAVEQATVNEAPFCRLERFQVEGRGGANRVLLVAPMAGHYATLLRETVRDLLPTHDVYITDWSNARDVPLPHGGFDLDDYIDHVIRYLRLLGAKSHVVAICQAGAPTLAAVALMADDPGCKDTLPASLALLGSPIDTAASPTEVNELARDQGIDWFNDTLISTVPAGYPGAHRSVYPGYLQLTAFVAMNPQRHEKSARDAIHHFADGDFASAEKIDSFYGEFLSTMDLTAEFYLQTVAKIFQGNELARGSFTWRGRPVDPAKITRTPILAIEADRDDITGIGQTRAALDLASGLADEHKRYFLLEDAGHYGLFSGSKFRNVIVPLFRDFQSGAAQS